jgi:hypothetical protein
MLKSKKHVFWEALLITTLIFILGIFIGMSFEKRNINIIESYYAQSEVSMMDMFVFQDLVETGNYNCEEMIKTTIDFADRVYKEALLLEPYEKSNILTENIILSHKKYDLLRTFIWINSIKISEKCQNDFTLIIYLYEYNTEDIAKIATQKVWSRILSDAKEKYGSEIILLPIAADNNLSSIDMVVNKFHIEKFPSIIINEKIVLNDLNSLNDLEDYIKK